MVRPPDSRAAFRCAIAPEHSAAVIKIDGKSVQCRVLDTSRTGFSIQVPNKFAKRMNKAKRIVLFFRQEQWLVGVESSYSDSADVSTFGLNRIRELTKLKEPNSWGLALMPKSAAGGDPMFLLYLTIAFVVACLCLPGIGDSLGTAPKVREAVKSVVGK